ncbi:hypothetical protein FHW67_002493 [Herbaspirillum sp. Sphag1AN]|nr:hypothetical protein [Herbaspirillum sp. Sphag1AN]MBB3246401.1 hypothetical protein [Herbaspirillum sp. Sphag64]
MDANKPLAVPVTQTPSAPPKNDSPPSYDESQKQMVDKGQFSRSLRQVKNGNAARFPTAPDSPREPANYIGKAVAEVTTAGTTAGTYLRATINGQTYQTNGFNHITITVTNESLYRNSTNEMIVNESTLVNATKS